MRPQVAFFDFSSCDGCRLAVAEAVQAHLVHFDAAEIVDFRATPCDPDEPYAIAFVEGSIASESDQVRISAIRRQAFVLVAVGACAHLGGSAGIAGPSSCHRVLKSLHGDMVEWFAAYAARPLSAVVPVDAVIPGCPVDCVQVVRMVHALVHGRKPPIPDFPVCVQCKMNEYVCVFDKRGSCLGPVTRAGCGAVCIGHGVGCEGCRGTISNPNRNAMKDVLVKYGLTSEEALARMTALGDHSIRQAGQPARALR